MTNWLFFLCYHWEKRLWNLIESRNQELSLAVWYWRRRRVNTGSKQQGWQTRQTRCICLLEAICWTVAAYPGQIRPCCLARAWGAAVSSVGCQLSIASSVGTARREKTVWYFILFLPKGIAVFHPSFLLILNGGWQFFLSHFISLSSLFSFCSARLVSLLQALRDEEGKREDQREPAHSALQYH